MLSGLMVMGAGAADFVDAEDIQHTEAVNTVTALGVINGKPVGDGKVEFDPDANIRRDEMAKIIAYVMNGGKEPVYSTGNYKFSDVPATQWASKYIYYCEANGIISGDGAGHFMPEQNVTASQAAKMILTVLGYNSDVFKLVGVDWESNTNSKANEPVNNLYEHFYDDYGNDFNPSAPATRDMIALMVYNALDAKIMTVTYNVNADGSNAGHTLKLEDETLLNDKFSAVEVTGVVTGNEYANLGATGAQKAGKTEITYTGDSITLFDSNATAGATGTFNVASGKDELGRAVKFFIKKGANAGKSTVVGSLAVVDSNNVIIDSGKDSDKKIADDNDLTIVTGTSSTPDVTTIYANYNGTAAYHASATAADAAGTVGVERIFIDNDGDDKIDYILKNETKFGKVTKYSTKDKGEIVVAVDGATLSKTNKADVVGFDDVKKGDYVNAVVIGGKLYVEKAEAVTGKLTRYKAATSLTVDGTTYKVSAVKAYDDGSMNCVDMDNGSGYTNTGVEATFYFDTLGYIVAVGNAEETLGNYAMVLGFDEGKTNLDDGRAKLLTSDGATKTYNIAKVQKYNTTSKAWDKVTLQTNTLTPGMLVTYTVDSDGKVVISIQDSNQLKDLAYVDGTSSDTAIKITKGKTSVTLDSSTYYASKNTVYFYADNATPGSVTEADIYVGYANAPKVDISGKYVAFADGDDLTAVILYGVTVADAGDYLYLYNYVGTDKDHSYFDAIIDGELVEGITVKDNTKNASNYGIYTYSVDSDNVYTLTAVEGTSGANKMNLATSSFRTGYISRVDGNNVFVAYQPKDANGSDDGSATELELVINDASVLASINGSKTSLDASVQEQDAVTVVVDGDKIEALFITKAYDEKNFALVVKSGNTGDVTLAGDTIELASAVSGNTLIGYFESVDGCAITAATANGNDCTTGDIDDGGKVVVTNTTTGASRTYSVKVG